MKPFVNEYLKGIIILLSLLSTISGHELVKRQADSQKKVVCYYANWSVYRQGVAKFTPQNINPYLCTHLIYAFGGLSKDDTVQPFDKYQDIEKNGYSKFAALKTYNKDLKTMLAIGGWNEGSKRFSPMVADPKRRNTFIRSAIGFLRRYNFDGIDLDWEYPTQRDGGKPEDKENYAIFIREMRNVFEDEAEKTGNDRLIISMAVPASLEYTAEGFDLENLDQDLDFFNILAYDYHSSYEPFVNHHSALFRTKAISEFDHRKDLNIDSTVKFYLKNGASREKIVLGIPTYGRSFTLINPDAHEIGSPSDGPGRQGEGTKEDGYLAYYEICNGIKDEKWEVVNPSPGETGPYAHKDTLWVGYDDEDIAREKAYYVAEEGLGGIMFWTIDNDDFRGKCHKKSFPLIEAAKKALYSSTSSVKTKHSNTVQSPPQSFTDRPRSLNSNFDPFHTPEPPTTPSSEPAFVCKDEGFFPHSKSCKKYYWCLEAAGVGMVAHTFTCPQGLFFNPLTDGCDFKRNVDCGEKSQKEEVQIQSTTTLSPKTDDESGNEKSLQEILSDIKSAGGLEAFEEQLEEEEKSKLALRQRTKDRNTNISSKTRNRFTKLLERKNPKDSKPKDDETSGSSNGNKRPGGNSFLSRLAQRRRNKNPSSSSTSSVSTTETSTKPPTSISPPSEKPTRPGFLRNRKRPSLLRKRPSITNNKQNEKETEETNVVLETSSARPRSPLLRNRFRNSNRGRQTTTSESPFIEEEPEEIKSTSRPTSFRPESRNRFRTAVQKDTDTAELDEDINNNIRNEEAPSFRARSRTPERKFRLPSVQNRGLPPRLTNSTSSIDTSRNLAYVNIDRSRGRPELSRTEPPLTPKAVTTQETPSDREGTVRDLEYVTIQRGGPSLLNEQNARERTDEDIEDLGEVSTTTIRDEIETTPPVPSSTSTSPTTTSVTTSSTTRSTTRRSLFRSFRRPKNPLFKRKKSPSKTPSLLATTATTTNLSSSSSSTSSSSTSPIITTATTPASTTSVPSSLSKSSSLFSRNQQSRKNRFSFKLNKIRRKPGSLKKSSAFVGNSEAEKKTSRNETKKEVTHQREPEDESVEGGGFLAGRLRQRLQKQRIKSSSSFVPPRSSLILLKKPTDSVPSTTTTTSTATTETAFFPTVADPEEEVYATIQTTTITTTTTTTTTTVYTTTTTTTTSTTASTPATTIPIIETTNFSSPTIPLPFVTTIPTPRPKTTIISSTPTQRAENPFISSTPTQRAENPFISSTISAEEEASLISSTPYPRRQLPFFSSTPSQRRKTILSTKPGPRRQTHFLSSTTTAPTPTTFRGRFPERPRRLNVFRNRFQGSPSSPRPFVSKSREEELFSEIQEQKTPRPLNQVPPPRRKESRARVSPSPFTTPAPTFATTTTPANTEPTSIISSPPRRFPPTRQRKPSRFRNTVSRPVHRRKPTTTTTTTPSFREYDYYTDDEYSVDENNVQNLKSVDPVYDYDLVPLSNKVTMSPEGPVCHDVGVFPHPISCKKFVTCSRRTARGRIDGWEYECPIYLAFDPIGGRCNWAADVDCH